MKVVILAAIAAWALALACLNARADSVVLASWYGGAEKLNAHTANGERFHANGKTVAHRTLPLGTKLRITYHGRSTICRVNDRGPAAWTGRSIDLARGCARAIGMHGVDRVRIARL